MDFFPKDIENLILSYLLQCKKCNKYDLKLRFDQVCDDCFHAEMMVYITKIIILALIGIPMIEFGFIYLCIYLVRN